MKDEVINNIKVGTKCEKLGDNCPRKEGHVRRLLSKSRPTPGSSAKGRRI